MFGLSRESSRIRRFSRMNFCYRIERGDLCRWVDEAGARLFATKVLEAAGSRFALLRARPVIQPSANRKQADHGQHGEESTSYERASWSYHIPERPRDHAGNK